MAEVRRRVPGFREESGPREECRVYCGCGERWPRGSLCAGKPFSASFPLTSMDRHPPSTQGPGFPGCQAYPSPSTQCEWESGFSKAYP